MKDGLSSYPGTNNIGCSCQLDPGIGLVYMYRAQSKLLLMLHNGCRVKLSEMQGRWRFSYSVESALYLGSVRGRKYEKLGQDYVLLLSGDIELNPGPSRFVHSLL